MPLSRDEAALQEAKAHALSLPSLLSLETGIDDEDMPFPMDVAADHQGFDAVEYEYEQYQDDLYAEEYDEWE